MKTADKIKEMAGRFSNVGYVECFDEPQTYNNGWYTVHNCIAYIECLGLVGGDSAVALAYRNRGFNVKKFGLDIFIVEKF